MKEDVWEKNEGKIKKNLINQNRKKLLEREKVRRRAYHGLWKLNKMNLK